MLRIQTRPDIAALEDSGCRHSRVWLLSNEESSKKMKKMLIASVLLVIAMFAIAAWTSNHQPASKPAAIEERSSQPSPSQSSQASQAQIHKHEYAAKGRVPAYYETPPDVATLPATLSPSLFKGNERLAYQAAKEIPQTLAQLPCYCHCDRGHGHKSLLSCFESEHGENCGICINEALMAYNLEKRAGLSVSEIRTQIIAAYGKP